MVWGNLVMDDSMSYKAKKLLVRFIQPQRLPGELAGEIDSASAAAR